jgi:prepilin-type processing-associated H-X9-DG protein
MNPGPEVYPAWFRRGFNAFLDRCLPVVGVLAALLLAAHGLSLRFPREAELRQTCKNNLRQIALACHAYAQDHDGAFPSSLESLSPEYISAPGALRCPRAKDRSAPSYALVPGLRVERPGGTILAYEVSAANHSGDGRNVAFVDGHVEWWRVADDAGFRRRLAEQAERLRAWAPGQEHLEREGVK